MREKEKDVMRVGGLQRVSCRSEEREKDVIRVGGCKRRTAGSKEERGRGLLINEPESASNRLARFGASIVLFA